MVHWRTGIHTYNNVNKQAGGGFRTEAQWIAMAEGRAIPACRARGGKYVAGSADFGPGHNEHPGQGAANFNGANLGWFFAFQKHSDRHGGNLDRYIAKARESRTWVVVCTKRVRRR